MTVEIGPAPRAAPPVADVVTGAGFSATRRGELVRELSLPDTVGPRMAVLVCGLNPSIYAAERGIPFARGSNRFWGAATAAGLVSSPRDPLRALTVDGVGFTDLVKRATAASAELAPSEYAAGTARVGRLVGWLGPRVVAFVGLEGWRLARDPRARPGLQPEGFAGRPAYVLPSTSGLNARSRPADLAAHLRRVVEIGRPRA